MSLREDIFAYERERRKLDKQQKDELKKRILSLSDNLKAKPLGKNAFVLNFADLGNKWSVEYNDFRIQYRLLVEMVDRAESPLSAVLRIRKAMKDKRVVVDKVAVPLHPNVVNGVRKALVA